MGQTSTQRVVAFRRRQRQRKIVLAIEVKERSLIEYLKAERLLREDFPGAYSFGERVELSHATAKLLDTLQWVNGVKDNDD